jgi:maltoporin
VRCSSRAPLGRSWTLDSALLWYGQNNDDGSDLRRVSPDFRLSYQAGKNVSLEVEVGVEDTNSQNATTQETTRRNFFSLGYRWDF